VSVYENLLQILLEDIRSHFHRPVFGLKNLVELELKFIEIGFSLFNKDFEVLDIVLVFLMV
jgi:hypothetical protein